MKLPNGFTFIEIVVVITILSVVLMTGSLQISAFQKRQRVEQACRTFEKHLQLAKQRALGGFQPPSGLSAKLTGYRVVPVAGSNSYTIVPVVNDINQSAMDSYTLSEDTDIIFASGTISVLFRTVDQGCALGGVVNHTYVVENDDGYACRILVNCPTGQIQFQGCS